MVSPAHTFPRFTDVLSRLGIAARQPGVSDGAWHRGLAGDPITSRNPATGDALAEVLTATRGDYDRCVEKSASVFERWRMEPAPQRGEIVRRIGQALREQQRDLGLLVTLESGKIRSEGEGEVQEMIDMCDFAVGLSRQLYGLTMATERPNHRLFEQWHPLGPVGVITAFNFPVAVWSWNAALALVCGDPVVWKPSPRTPLTAIAVQHLVQQVLAGSPWEGLLTLCIHTGPQASEWMADDPRLPLISATGSCAMGRHIAPRVAARLGRSLLELGGNNAIIVTPQANVELALRAVAFAAAGTAGQRCTSLRRLFVHASRIDDFTRRLVDIYRSIPIGNPWEDGVLMGPLISEEAVDRMEAALQSAVDQGGHILYGGRRLARPGYFVEPALVRATPEMPIVQQETFAPILYVMAYQELDEAIAGNNRVPQGLSSALFSDSLRECERFLSPSGSDCGIANINVGTYGAEIGGAFGGEKDTGGGREAGSDAWKTYMRRQTCTVNFGATLPLAQGVRFDVGP
ncbi:MAG: aldehyde dehydrogenase family protein [Pirellulaceae bacterium]